MIILYLILLLIITSLSILLFSNFYLHLVLNEKRKTLSFKWLFFSLGSDWKSKEMTLSLFSWKILTKKIKEKPIEEKKIQKKKIAKKKGKIDFYVLWGEKSLIIKILKIVLSYFKNLLKRIKFDRLSLETKIATPDPALTGILYGGISGLAYSFGLSPLTQKVKIEPDFQATSAQAKIEVGLRTKSRDIFYYTTKMFFSLPKIKMVKLIKKAYKKRR